MNEFLQSFVPAPDGSWMCVRSCSHMSPHGLLRVPEGARFVRGQLIVGIDIVSLLDHRLAFANGD